MGVLGWEGKVMGLWGGAVRGKVIGGCEVGMVLWGDVGSGGGVIGVLRCGAGGRGVGRRYGLGRHEIVGDLWGREGSYGGGSCGGLWGGNGGCGSQRGGLRVVLGRPKCAVGSPGVSGAPLGDVGSNLGQSWDQILQDQDPNPQGIPGDVRSTFGCQRLQLCSTSQPFRHLAAQLPASPPVFWGC